MIVNGRIVSDYDIRMRRHRDQRTREHREAMYPGEYRILLSGSILSHNKHSFNLEFWFFDHLRAALSNPATFLFDGYIGKEGSQAWLEHHRVRFKLDRWEGEIKFLDPDERIIDRYVIRKESMHASEEVGTIATCFDRFPCRVEIGHRNERGYYTYQPQRYTDPDAAVTSYSSLMPYEKNADGSFTNPVNRWYPYFATPDEAVSYMAQNKVHGCVLRYAITDDLGPLKKRTWIGRDEACEYDNNPYLTAGVVRCVETKDREAKGLAHASAMSVLTGDITEKDVVYL